MDVVHSEYGILYSLTTPPKVARPTTASAIANTTASDRQYFLQFLLLRSFLQNHRGFLFAER
ncbi:hypothetical protein KPNIH14_16339 [Klebsiella pneumoniae subsp. pneumoniae KPNIH14]|nr:hypothetical protein KPNIH14_16339 [Klebsiella pneumoniae subsp. pneumoniae KPNIH14]